jgi:hypothetical protein
MYTTKAMRDHNGVPFPGKPTAREFVRDAKERIRARQGGSCSGCSTTVPMFDEKWLWVNQAPVPSRWDRIYPPLDVRKSQMVCLGCGTPEV